MTVTLRTRDDINLKTFERVAFGGEDVRISDRARRTMQRMHDQYQKYVVANQNTFIYGVTAGVYLASLPVIRGRGQRDLSSALWAVALTAGAVGVADLVSGNELALVWAAEGALLSWLGLRTREPRLLLGALGYLGLALGETLVLAAAPTELFVANDDPAEGVPAVLATAAALVVFAFMRPPPVVAPRQLHNSHGARGDRTDTTGQPSRDHPTGSLSLPRPPPPPARDGMNR